MTGASTPLSRDELVASGRAALLAGDHDRARELLDTAVRRDPGDAEAWVWLSGTQSEPAEMAACLNRALVLDPSSFQAREGLRWIADTYGDAVAYPRSERHAQPGIRHAAASTAQLAEAAVHPFAAGVLLGLTRLAGWLRPETLAQLRPDDAALGFGGALLPAVVAAATHAAALLLAWAVLGAGLATVRARGRGDRFDSLRLAGAVWEPGLVWGAALGIVAFGLLFAPLVWPATVVLSSVALAWGVALIGLRVRRLFRSLDVATPAAVVVSAACVAAALLGCWLAGIVSAAVL